MKSWSVRPSSWSDSYRRFDIKWAALQHDKYAGHTTAKKPLYPSAFNGFMVGWGGVIWGRFGGVRRSEPVGGSKVPSTFVLQTAAAARCMQGITYIRAK